MVSLIISLWAVDKKTLVGYITSRFIFVAIVYKFSVCVSCWLGF